jgi:hypothetical protein
MAHSGMVGQPQEGHGFEPSGVQVRLLLLLDSTSLAWTCQLLLWSGLLLCLEKKKKTKKYFFTFIQRIYFALGEPAPTLVQS